MRFPKSRNLGLGSSPTFVKCTSVQTGAYEQITLENAHRGERAKTSCKTRRVSSIYLYVICSLLFQVRGHALNPAFHISQYGHTAWRIQDGTVISTMPITQTADGYIWMASRDGLMRFDGVRFVLWNPPKGTSFPARNFTFLFGSSDGSLWVGTPAGLSRIKDGQLLQYTKPTERSGIYEIIEDHAGRIWVTRYRVPKGEGALCQVVGQGLHCYGPADGIAAPYGLGLAEDKAGNLWFGSKVLYRWKPGSQASTYLDNIDKLHGDGSGVMAVAAGPSGDVWAGFDCTGPQLGLRHFLNGKSGEYVAKDFHSSTVWSERLLFDRSGALWIGTVGNGLYRIWHGVIDHYTTADGLSGHYVEYIYEDREGNIWATTDGGVDMFRDLSVASFSMSEGLGSAVPFSIVGLHDGSVLVAGNVPSILPPGTPRPVLRGPKLPDTAWSLFEDHDGILWIGLTKYLVTYDHGNVEKVTMPDGHPIADGRDLIDAVVESPVHTIWAVTHSHLFRITHHSVEEDIPIPQSLQPDSFLAVAPGGGIWLGPTRGAVGLYRDGHMQIYSLPGDADSIQIRGLVADSEDPLLIPTSIGLFRWDGSRWNVLDTHNGLPCNQILGAIKDRHASLWLYTQCGVLMIKAAEVANWRGNANAHVSITLLDAVDGAHPGMRNSLQPLISMATDGTLWSTSGSIVQTINPDHLYRNPLPPPVHIEELIADSKPYQLDGQTHLPPKIRNLEIDYTGLSFSVPQKVQFRYLLEGHDTAWQGPVTRRQVFYTDLAPGSYRFHVMASNNSGVWNEAGDSAAFVVEAAYYQTLWFKALIAITSAGLLWTLYLMRMRQATRLVRDRLCVQMEERERIARELHDTLLQGFQGLVLRFQAVTKKMSVQDPVRNMMEEVLDRADDVLLEGRQRVLGLRQTEVTNDELPDRLAECGEKLAQDHNASFSLTIVGAPRVLVSTVHDETYRIAGEALSNAFRHAQASQIEAEVTFDSSVLRLRVRDDGIGIDRAILSNGHPGHWGVTGMRERAHSIGAELNIWSREGAGTEIDLVIPGSIAYPRKRPKSH